MPLPPTVPHIVGDDDFDENSPMLRHHLPVPDSTYSDSSEYEDDDVSEEESDLDGADWSMNVTQIPGTPGHIPNLAYADSPPDLAIAVGERVQSPILALEDDDAPRPKMGVAVESSLSFLNLVPTDQATGIEVDMAKAQVPASTPTNSKIIAGGARKSPNRMQDTAVAKPIEITAYFHEVSAYLVRSRIKHHSYIFLRDHIDRRMQEVEVEVESSLSFLNLKPADQATGIEVNRAEAQVPDSTATRDDPSPKPSCSRKPRNFRSAQPFSERTLRSNSKIIVGGVRKSPNKMPDTALAKPIDITAYLQEVSAYLVRSRVKCHSFIFLRDHIDRLLGEIFEDYKPIPKMRKVDSIIVDILVS